MEIVHVVKFLPLALTYGQIQVQRMDLVEFLKHIDSTLTKLEQELLEKTRGKKILNTSLEISQVSLGPVSGLLIVMYALVEDSEDKSSPGSS